MAPDHAPFGFDHDCSPRTVDSFELDSTDSDALLPTKHSPRRLSTSQRAPASATRRVSWAKEIFVTSLVLLSGVALGRWAGSHAALATLARADGAQAAATSQVCIPYDLPGRLNVSSTVLSENKWIPLRDEPGCDVLDYMHAIRQAVAGNSSAVHDVLEYVRGKTVLLVGDSVDRGHLHHICDHLGGELEMIGADHELSPPYPEGEELPPEGYVSQLDGTRTWPSFEQSRPWSCYVRAVDLLFVNTFHYGFKFEDDWIAPHVHHYPPAELTARLTAITAPLAANLGRALNRTGVPDLISITTGFWDLLRDAKADEQLGLDQWRPMPDHLARWYARRTAEVLRHVGSLWPTAEHPPRIVWRTLHRTRLWDDIPATRRTALDQITRAVVSDMLALDANLGRRLAVNRWADAIDGLQFRSNFFLDNIHPGTQLSYLYANILLDNLRQEHILRSVGTH